jgi:1-acyl-sn-glycerol-3-phosphate acyltransferase
MRRFLFTIWYVPVFAILTIITGILCLTLSFVSKRLVRWITSAVWAHVVLDPAAFKVVCLGRETLPDPSSGGFIIFANHRSILDIPTVARATGRSISWVAKAALGRIPVFGWTLQRVHLLVDRGGSAEAAKAMIAEASARLANGEIMAIFPEGTRNKTEAPLLPFKKGAFILAKHTGAPLVPLAIEGTGRLWPSGRLIPNPGPGLVRVAIGAPMGVRPDESLNQIAKRAQETMEALYLNLRGENPSEDPQSPPAASKGRREGPGESGSMSASEGAPA